MNVLLIMTARQIGGAELYVERLVLALSDVCLFTIAISDAPGMAQFGDRLARLPNVSEVKSFPFDRTRRLFGISRELRALARTHDVVHLNSNHPVSRLGILMGFALAGLPWVAVEQRATPPGDVSVPRSVAWALPGLFRLSRGSAARVIAVSQENARTLKSVYRLPSEQVQVVYNGADLTRGADSAAARPALRAELGLAPDAAIILVLARLLPNKGHRYLIGAAPRILGAHPGAHFVFAGALDDPKPLEDGIAALGLTDRFSLLGFRTDTPALLAASDVFVLPSLAEGFALTILEALVAGLPVVATAVGGAPEIIEDRVNGFLVPPADSAALAHAVSAALALDAERRASLKQAALASAQRFSIDAMARQMLEIYRAARR